MKKLALIPVFAFIFIITAIANDTKKSSENKNVTTTITGSVIDKSNGESLPGVSVKITEAAIVVYSDFEGNFEINNLIPGTYTIQVDYIAYKKNNKQVSISMNKENHLKLELEMSE